MKFTLTVTLLLIAASQAAEDRSSRSKQKKEDTKTEKRALVEGNAAVEKRAPVLSTALPSATPGIVYADSNGLESDKSSKQEIYATPVPQLAKISDVLTGQGPPFQAAIASHLFSPVSIYQTRLPGYEVSAPVPAQLAYSEKITYQQPQQQFVQQLSKETPKSNFRLTYQQPQYQSLPQRIPQTQPIQYQQLVNQYQPALQTQPQLLQQHQLQSQFYNQAPFPFQNPFQLLPQPLAYFQQQIPNQPGILYAKQEDDGQTPTQRELKTIQTPQQNLPQKTVNTQNQGAVSYASFSVGPTASPQQQYQPQPQVQQYQPRTQTPQYQPEPQPQKYQPQPQQYQLQQQPDIQQYQLNPQPQIIHYSTQLPGYQPQQPQQTQSQQYQLQQTHYQIQETQNKPSQPEIQSQRQYQIERIPSPFKQNIQYHQEVQPQATQKLQPAPANSINVSPKPAYQNNPQPLTYYRPEPIYQPQVPQIYPGQEIYQNQLTGQSLASPTFPPVQFFGKFARELFKNYQSQPQ